MKRIFTTLFFVAVMSTTVNANVRDFSFPYFESTKTKVASYTTTKKPTKHARAYKKSKRTVMRNKASYASVSTPGARFNAGPRPGKWCGHYMRTLYGGGPEYNRAVLWKNRGRAASPGPGVIVVWPHHVGVIVGRADNGKWLVHSGNDGGKVRTRARSVAGAVAFRRL